MAYRYVELKKHIITSSCEEIGNLYEKNRKKKPFTSSFLRQYFLVNENKYLVSI